MIPAVEVPFDIVVSGGKVHYTITAGAAKGVSVWWPDKQPQPTPGQLQKRLLEVTVEWEKKL